jgi:hypothetical protein
MSSSALMTDLNEPEPYQYPDFSSSLTLVPSAAPPSTPPPLQITIIHEKVIEFFIF